MKTRHPAYTRDTAFYRSLASEIKLGELVLSQKLGTCDFVGEISNKAVRAYPDRIWKRYIH
jgi:hypothetical protein